MSNASVTNLPPLLQDECTDLKSTRNSVQIKVIGPIGERFYLLDSAGHLWVLSRDNLRANITLTIDSAPLNISQVFDGIDEPQLAMAFQSFNCC